MPARAALAFALALGASATARAECAGQDEARWLGHHSLVLLLNPTGAEYNGRLGLCGPLYDDDGAFVSLNHVEGGASLYVSPVYAIGGGYVQVAPVSFLYLRAELHGLAVWPIPLSGAGFYLRDGYDQGWRTEQVPAEDGEAAGGWSARFKAVLQGSVPIGPHLEIVLVYTPWLEINVVDRGEYWVDVRDDLIAANGDWVFAHEGVLLLGVRLPERATVRFGAFSALRGVPASGYVGHRAGAFVMASFGGVDPAVSSLDVFLRLGLYSHHAFRRGQLSTMAGISVDHDLGGW